MIQRVGLKQVFLASLAFFLMVLAGVSYADTGSSSTTMTLIVPVVTTVNCASSSVNAPSGTQTNTLNVLCTVSGNSNSLAAGTANSFGPGSVTLTSGGNTLTATLQSAVTSPDSSITGISGTSAGFTGTLSASSGNVWKVQSTYHVPTVATTPSGTYTGTATYTWSTL